MIPLSYPRRLALVVVLLLGGCQGSTEQQVNSHVEKAQAHFAAGELNANIIELKNALKMDPDHARARWLLGKTYIDMQQGKAAIKELRKARKLGAAPAGQVFEDLLDALLLDAQYQAALDEISAAGDSIDRGLLDTLAGRAYLGLKEYDTAEASFQAVLSASPDDLDGLLGLAAVHTGRQQYRQAASLLDRVLAIQPDHAQALSLSGELHLLLGDLDRAAADFQALLERGPDGELPAYLGLARVRFAQQDVQAAEALVGKARAIAPRDPLATYLSAVLHYQRKDFQKARKDLDDVLKTNPNHPKSLLLSGSIAYAEGRTALAEENLRRYLAIDPAHLPARKLLAAIQTGNKQNSEALRTLEGGLSNAQQDGQYLAMLGSAYMRAGEQSKGMAMLEKALTLSPDAAGIRTQLAIGHLMAGAPEAATAELEDAVELGQNLIQADLLLAMTRLKARDYDGARSLAETMTSSYPDQAMPYNLLGTALLGKGETEAARQQFRKALDIDNTFTPAALNLAQLETREGNPSQAVDILRSALIHEPNSEAILIALSRHADRAGDQAAAEEYLQQSRKGNPGAIATRILLGNYYLGTGRKALAREIAAELKALHSEDPRVLLYLGRVAESSGELDDAEQSYRLLNSRQPEFAEGWLRLANIQAMQGNSDASRASLEKLLALSDGRHAGALYGLGKLALAAGDLDGARQQADRLQEYFPDNLQAIALQAAILEADGDLGGAIDKYRAILSARPNTTNMMRLAQAYRGNGQAAEADRLLDEWAREHPDDQSARMAIAARQQMSGSRDEALGAYLELLDANPDNAVVLNNVAWIYHQQGSPKALEYAERAHRAAPGNAAIQDTLGWLRVQDAQVEQGLRLLESALQRLPANPEIRYHYAAALALSGDRPQARRELEKVLASPQDFPGREDAEALLKTMQ